MPRPMNHHLRAPELATPAEAEKKPRRPIPHAAADLNRPAMSHLMTNTTHVRLAITSAMTVTSIPNVNNARMSPLTNVWPYKTNSLKKKKAGKHPDLPGKDPPRQKQRMNQPPPPADAEGRKWNKPIA